MRTWRIQTLFLGSAVISSFLAVFSGFWDPKGTNHNLLFGLFLVLVVSISIFALNPKTYFAVGLRSAAVFGWSYLILVLKGGFGLETIFDSQALEKNTQIGFALMGIAFLVSQFLASFLMKDEAD